MQIDETYTEDDWYHSPIYSRSMILSPIWAAEKYIIIPAHQSHQSFMEHLHKLICDKPKWAEETKTDNLKWGNLEIS